MVLLNKLIFKMFEDADFKCKSFADLTALGLLLIAELEEKNMLKRANFANDARLIKLLLILSVIELEIIHKV